MSARTKEFSSGTWSTHELTCTWGEKGLSDDAHTGKLNATVGRKREGESLIPDCNGLVAAVVFRRVGKRIIRLEI